MTTSLFRTSLIDYMTRDFSKDTMRANLPAHALDSDGLILARAPSPAAPCDRCLCPPKIAVGLVSREGLRGEAVLCAQGVIVCPSCNASFTHTLSLPQIPDADMIQATSLYVTHMLGIAWNKDNPNSALILAESRALAMLVPDPTTTTPANAPKKARL